MSGARLFPVALAVWGLYGLGTYLAVLPDVPPGGHGRMAALKLVRTLLGLGAGLGLVAALRRMEGAGVAKGARAAWAVALSAAGGYAWLALYHALTAGLRGPDFFPAEPARFPREGLDHVVVLLAWSGAYAWWRSWSGHGGGGGPAPDAVAGVQDGAAAGEGVATAAAGDGSETDPLRPDDHVYLRLDDRMAFLRVETIRAILADGDYTRVVREGERDGLADRSMREWEALLPERLFARIHRSVIVNLGEVERLEPRPGGGKWVHLRGGRKVRMSRRYEARLRDRLG